MASQCALKSAIDLLNAPSRLRATKSHALPSDVSRLLRIAAGDERAMTEAVQATQRSPEFIKEAAEFYIEQILFLQDADSYRILGADPKATASELRNNMALLIRWLHPDHDPKCMRSVFISRVTGAWDDLKTDERRAAYDRKRAPRSQPKQNKRQSQSTSKAQRRSGSQKTKRVRRRGDSMQQRRKTGSRHLAKGRQVREGRQLGLFRKLMLLVFSRTIR